MGPDADDREKRIAQFFHRPDSRQRTFYACCMELLTEQYIDISRQNMDNEYGFVRRL